MIKLLKLTDNFRSYHDTCTGDVIMQGNPDGKPLFSYADGESYFLDGHYEVIVRGETHAVDAHINHKRAVVQCLRGYTSDEVETLSESSLDGILRDSAESQKQEALHAEKTDLSR